MAIRAAVWQFDWYVDSDDLQPTNSALFLLQALSPSPPHSSRMQACTTPCDSLHGGLTLPGRGCAVCQLCAVSCTAGVSRMTGVRFMVLIERNTGLRFLSDLEVT